jgi:glucokinase
MEENGSNILAGDIGGTKTNLAIFADTFEKRAPLYEATFVSQEYPSLEMLTLDFLSQTKYHVTKASFCVAGPVVGGRSKITNLTWDIDREKLISALGISHVNIYNDLQAFAHAVPQLRSEDFCTLNSGSPPPKKSTILVLAPGTGLGMAYLTYDGRRYFAHPSEGGHVDFAPTSELEMGLLRFLLKRFGHVSYERVCSGIGLPNIYDYLKESGREKEPLWLKEMLAGASKPAQVISNAALDDRRPCRLCRKSLELFVSILGAAAGNAALSTMALGGVYLGGGIPPADSLDAEKRPFYAGLYRERAFFPIAWRYTRACHPQP